MPDPIGLLALQGDFQMHHQAFARLEAPTRLVRRPAELIGCSGLVIPGGESTTLARLLDRSGLRRPLQEFAATHPVMGTCAGLILMARDLEPEVRGHHGVEPLGLLDCRVQRNGYGRQINSFSDSISLGNLNGSGDPFLAVFIRAPRILAVGSAVEIVATREQEPVVIRQGKCLGLTFHPELTDDQRVHKAFLAMVNR